ncbi:MAG: serine/threonine-protein phosphatase [Lachnospiraceae bacterium]|nr:serine/threonine-protein phosphatase [Lachnospiraceae bacterium]MBD5481167.1 serine/threonine-protein phosphatase [Lachnospiraceae bacterium]
MIITYKIQKGINKDKCDDSALIGSQVVNNEIGSTVMNGMGRVFICDGVGGNAGGDEASLFVLNQISDIRLEDSKEAIRTKLLSVNDALISYAKTVKGHESMATTLTGLFFEENRVILAHCGNTRIYVIQGSFLKQMTSDQTTYQWLLDTNNHDAAEHCNKSEIRGAFGGGTSKFANTLIVEEVFERGLPGKILMTSDGIHDVVDIDTIEDIVTNDNLVSKDKVQQLISLAVENGSTDDCSAVLIEMSENGITDE